ncbi:hypothetical protein GCM10007386_56590 [Pseudoduganella dura]|nr:hypothetical protein GCM10007386_56590 [Pseudoduganella dura]
MARSWRTCQYTADHIAASSTAAKAGSSSTRYNLRSALVLSFSVTGSPLVVDAVRMEVRPGILPGIVRAGRNGALRWRSYTSTGGSPVTMKAQN